MVESMLRRFTMILTLAIALALGCDEGSSSESALAAAPAEGPVAIEVGSRGYTPSKVEARAGQPLTLVFTRTSDQGCGDELAIPSQNIERDLPLNEPVEVTFTPEDAGEVTFTCGMGMYDGKVVVR